MAEGDGRLVAHSTYEMLIKNGDNEAEVHTLHSYKYEDALVPSADLASTFITQAEPTNIHPLDTTPIPRDHQLIAVIPDLQYGFRHIGTTPPKPSDNGKSEYRREEQYEPLHDPRAMHAARAVCRALQPDTIVLQGDLMDFSEVSRYEADSPHFTSTLQLSLNGLHKYLASLRADNPHAKIVGLEGNHEARLAKTVLRHNAQLAGIKRANLPQDWNTISLPFLLRFDELGIQWYSGYPANEYRYSDNLAFVHGHAVRSSGSSAAKYSSDYPDTSVIFGHIHRSETHSRTDRRGQHHEAASFGTLSRIDGVVPSYHNGVDNKSQTVKRYENWQQGMGLVRAYNDGYLEIQPVRIKNGIARIAGVEYGAE